MSTKTYKVKITYLSTNKSEIIEFQTRDLKWTLEQYQRNRNAFTWEILD